MKRIASIIAALSMLLMLVPMGTSAGPTPTLFENGYTFDRYSLRSVGGNVVDQQSDQQYPETPRFSADNLRYVINIFSPNRECAWDIDESWDLTELGELPAGATATAEFCFITDQNPQYVTINGNTRWWSGNRGAFGTLIRAKSADLLVTVTWPVQNRSFTLLPIYNKELREYVYGPWCGTAVYRETEPLSVVPYIVGSNFSNQPGSVDGRGVRSPIVLSVTNAGNNNVRLVKAFVERIAVWQGETQTCDRDRYLASTRYDSYPFWWLENKFGL